MDNHFDAANHKPFFPFKSYSYRILLVYFIKLSEQVFDIGGEPIPPRKPIQDASQQLAIMVTFRFITHGPSTGEGRAIGHGANCA